MMDALLCECDSMRDEGRQPAPSGGGEAVPNGPGMPVDARIGFTIERFWRSFNGQLSHNDAYVGTVGVTFFYANFG